LCVRLLLLQGLYLLRNELNQLLKVLELRRYDLQQLLYLSQLLLLKDLQLLQLLWNVLKKLQNLLQMLCASDPRSRLTRKWLTVLLRKGRDAKWLAPIWIQSP
jgi:hypothetical protein